LLQTGRFCLANLHAEMALFCTQYLASSPFSLGEGDASVEAHCLTGYYGLLDYAVANWWKHVKRLTRDIDQPTINALTMLSMKKDTPAADGIVDMRSRIQQLQDDGREWEKLFPSEDWIKPIRDCIEGVVNNPVPDNNPTELDAARELYGCPRYKCTKPWCYFFLSGFDTKDARDDHLSQHDRPFRCITDGCLGSQVGFAKESDLLAHNHRLHPQGATDTDAVEFPSTAEIDIFTAASEGKLAIVQDLVEGGANVNETNEDEASPLFLAVKARQYDVCQWLLEHGARVNALCTKRRVTALHAAVSNGDAELARLLIADYSADVYARDKSGKSVVQLMRAKGKEAVATVAPPGSLDHSACTKGICQKSIHRRTLNAAISDCATLTLRGILDGPNAVCLDLNESWSGRTALHEALSGTSRDPTGVAMVLLQTGRVDCDLTDGRGNLPLHYACQRGLAAVVPEILARTTFTDIENGSGYTPFELLLQCRSDDSLETRARRAKLTSYMLESGREDLSAYDYGRGGSILRLACKVSTREVLCALLPHTRHLDNPHTAQDGQSIFPPFHFAVVRGDLSVIAALLEDKRDHQPDTDADSWTTRERDYLRLTELIGKRDPSLLAMPSVATPPFSLLHFGAYHLDQAIIQQIINLESGIKGNPALFKWTPPSLGPDFVSNGSSRLPVFVAMSAFWNQVQVSASAAELEALRTFLSVFDALISSTELFKFPFSDLESNSNAWVDEVILTNKCCYPEMVTRMALAGFTLPWKLLRWASDGNILITQDPSFSQGSALKMGTVLAVVCSGRCRFVGILRENLALAQSLLEFGSISPGSLVLDGDELEILQTLLQFFSGHSLDLLQELIRLGFNAGSALVQAANVGLEKEIELLLKTSDVTVLLHVATARNLAVSEGFEKIAEMLAL